MSTTTEIAEKKTNSETETQIISFKIGSEEFGIPIRNIKEILKISTITPIPRAPAYLLGMMNLRGAILPVLDLKKKLNLGNSLFNGKTRILVMQIENLMSGVVVDEVSQVQRIASDTIESPPQVVRGIDRFYLQGVARIGSQNRLIMLLNLAEILDIHINRPREFIIDSGSTAATSVEKSADTTVENGKYVDEVQVVVFNLGEEEFGLDIASVKEILKIGEITSVPNVPKYVKGIRGIRGTILPIIDLRSLIGMQTLEEQQLRLAAGMKQDHIDWIKALKESVYKRIPFTRALDPSLCDLGKRLENQKAHDLTFVDTYDKIKPPHDFLHETGRKVLNQAREDMEAAEETLKNEITPTLDTIMALFLELEQGLFKKARRDQRILVVDIDRATVGVLVDGVTQVSRLPKSVIDSTPAVVSSYGKEIKGIAKLDQGNRLVLLMDETLLFSNDEKETISQIREEQEAAAPDHKKEKDIVEHQYVVFDVKGEEFGLSIQRVKEIFKTGDITPVPKSPTFIKGVTNLRGSIIPVVDVRERFGMDRVQKDMTHRKSGKVLASLVKDTVIGLLVDNVNEVLCIPETAIEDAPSLVLSNIDTGYLQGIAKLDGGKRIILLLEIEEIMTEIEFKALSQLKAQAAETARIQTARRESDIPGSGNPVAPELRVAETPQKKKNTTRGKKKKE